MFTTLEQAFAWLKGLPSILDVHITRQNVTGTETGNKRNIHSEKNAENGDWEIRISFPLPVPGKFWECVAEPLGWGASDNLLDAISTAREMYERLVAERYPQGFPPFDFTVWAAPR